ncbi:hypothetical protein [Microseira wollei]|nr:hypothetical protein [Microseira wollei]
MTRQCLRSASLNQQDLAKETGFLAAISSSQTFFIETRFLG